MFQFLKKVRRGQMRVYFQFLALLLIVAATLVVVPILTADDPDCYFPGVTACDNDPPPIKKSKTTTSSTTPNPVSFQGRMAGQFWRPSVPPGDPVGFLCSGQCTGDGPCPDKVTYVFTPPPGATGFVFEGAQPEPGGPPFVFRDVPRNEAFAVGYDAPSLPPGKDEMYVSTTLNTFNGDGSSSLAVVRTLVKEEEQALASAGGPPTRQWEAPTVLETVGLQQDDLLWQVGQWIDPQGITLTTEICQGWLEFLQDDSVFLAARLPVAIPAVPTHSYTLPLVFGREYSATLNLIEFGLPETTHLTIPLEYRTERFTFLENELPAVEGERWAALGLSSESIACPPDLNLAMNDWSLLTEVWLDMSHQPDNCQGCPLDLHYCYEGQEQPMLAGVQQAVAEALAGPLGVATYQGWGITCIGPDRLTLRDTSEWELGGGAATWITSTSPISFEHHIYNWTPRPGTPLTFTLDFTSTLEAGLGIYADPQGETPVDGPFRVDATGGRVRSFWLIGQVPPGTAGGSYALLITATLVTSPEIATASDLVWLGDWVAPPLWPTHTPTPTSTPTNTPTPTSTPTNTPTPTSTPTTTPTAAVNLKLYLPTLLKGR